jgi:uncharacterized membrane protein YfcA
MELGLWELALLVGVALCAGLVDAIAGGGGLLTLPALLAVGLPPHLALGTNKGQSVFGAFAALARYQRARLVDLPRARVTFPLGVLGSAVGAAGVVTVRPEALRPIVLFLLVAVAVFMALYRPPPASAPPLSRARGTARAAVLALGIGCYDGFFGPGTGTFLIAGWVGLLAAPLPNATADAKVVNFASNLAAVTYFGLQGLVLWKVALPMAVGQFVGGLLGAHVAVRGGARLIRWVVLAVVTALLIKVGFDLASAGG